jgi:manganese-dependent inorganic pyrophosphatase
MEPILVTSYVDPDLDGVASMVAYAEYLQKTGTNAVAGIIGKPQIEADYMLRRFGVVCPDTFPNADGFDKVILVDASNPNDLEGTVPLGKVIEIIDHRAANEADAFPNAKARIELVGAAATLVVEKFMHDDVGISEGSAALLCGGIISNTYNFKGGLTTDRDREAFAWLNATAKLPADFWKELFIAKSDVAGVKLAERMRSDFSWFLMGDIRVGIAEIELLGARALIRERSGEIVRELERIKEEMRLDVVFQNTVELEEMRTFLVAPDTKTQELLHDVLHVRFTGTVAELPYPFMRKQLVPLLKKTLG